MIRTFCVVLLTFALTLAPFEGHGLQATPAPGCPAGWYPAVGAIGVNTGDVQWFKCSPFETWRTVPGTSEELVLVHETSPDFHQVLALDPVDGSEYWRKQTARIPYAPGQFDGAGVVLLPVGDRVSPALIGVEHKTGKELWRIESAEIPLAHSATVAVIGDSDLLTGPVPVRAIDRMTGEERWASEVLFSDLSGASVGRSPVVMLGDIVVVPTGDTISALDVETGALLWTAPHLSFLTAADHAGVIVGVEGGDRPGAKLVALNAASGERLWSARGGASYGGLLAVGDGIVVVLNGSRSEMVAYELATGNERWRGALSSRVEPQMVVGTLVVALWEGQLSVLSTADGSVTWSTILPFGAPWMNSVGANGNVVVVAINSRPWSD